MKRNSTGNFELTPIKCQVCGNFSSQKNKLDYPKEFAVRLLNANKSSDFERIFLPKFDKYRITKFLQFNKK